MTVSSTPFISATYESLVPKSVRRVTRLMARKVDDGEPEAAEPERAPSTPQDRKGGGAAGRLPLELVGHRLELGGGRTPGFGHEDRAAGVRQLGEARLQRDAAQ